jgi:HAD superfamily phosphatase
MSTSSAIVIFDIDGVIRDVGNSYRRALADTVEHYTQGAYRPTQQDIDALKEEGIWNNDWEASQEFISRYFKQQRQPQPHLSYEAIVDFFQRRYRGTELGNPDRWDGYITQEPLLVQPAYFQTLTAAGVLWGFFSGATQGSAKYVLEKRLGLQSPVLVAMEDAPGKPDPTGLFQAALAASTKQRPQLNATHSTLPIFYVGDTVADMYTITHAQSQQPDRQWIGVGILPPHAQAPADYASDYTHKLKQAGAAIVLDSVGQLTPTKIEQLLP